MPPCQLCRNDRVLRNSHIVPEFLYADLYNDKGHFMAINGRGRRGWEALQKGIREPLFCEACEQFFNEHFEKPFLNQWVRASPLPDPWPDMDAVVWRKFDYSTFKLFHLCVLYRADVSSLPHYSKVSLGPHRETLRTLLLNRDPGSEFQFPVLGYAIVQNGSRRLVKLISQSQRSKFDGHQCYGMVYGGVEWWVSVSSHRNPGFAEVALRPSGDMPFHAAFWSDVPVVQAVSNALRRIVPVNRN
jgi:hypothetical protein